MSSMPVVVGPDTVVSVSYVILNQQGEALEKVTDPLTYVHGYAQILPGLEQGLEGLSKGQTRQFTVEPEDAYGLYDDEAVFEIAKDELGDLSDFHSGDQLVVVHDEAGDETVWRILEVRADSLLVDANHPLAGQTLTFQVEVNSVRQASEDEISEAQAELESHTHSCECGHEHHEEEEHDHGGPLLIQLRKKDLN